MRAIPFLYFKGNCESALRFYQTCGLGEIVELRRIEGTPLRNAMARPGIRKCCFPASKVPDSVSAHPTVPIQSR
jgi:uncharacterized glyoxalase superfamily protein PhnB